MAPFALGVLLLLSGCAREVPRMADGAHQGLKCSACHAGSSGAEFVSGDRCVECHRPSGLTPEVRIAGVRFPHRDHGEWAPDAAISCSACHVHSGAAEDLRIDSSSCFLCHADAPVGGSVRDASVSASACLDCHAQPTHVAFRSTGFPIDHGVVLERGISCLQCHFDVMEGAGAVPEESCLGCHDAAELVTGEDAAAEDARRDPGTVHAQHARKGAEPACSRCHEPIRHEVRQVDESLLLTCRDCHAATAAAMQPPIDAAAHRVQQLMYIGLSDDAAARPDPMFLARVECAGCHTSEAMKHPRGSKAMRAAIAEECDACHGDGYAAMMDGWVAGVQTRTERVGRYVQAAAKKVDAASAVRKWEFVRAANGIHNLAGADAMLRNALDDAAAAYRAAGVEAPERPRLGPDPAQESCVRCHFGIETVAPASGFNHGAHVRDSRFDCKRCHAAESAETPHGLTDLERADCTCCHSGNRYGGG